MRLTAFSKLVATLAVTVWTFLLPNPMLLFKAETRAELGPKVIPPLKRLVSLLEEMGRIDAHAKGQIARGQLELWSLLALLDDAETEAKLKKNAESKEPTDAALAQSALLISRWWKNDTNAAEQQKIITDLQALARTYPQDNIIAQAAMMMLQQGASKAELKQQVEGIIVNDLKGDLAKELGQHIQAINAMRNLENKPLVITGTTLDGKAFTSADWKGKVVLVDFWATWCRPCLAELPRVQKLYKDFHDKGLEIVGNALVGEVTAVAGGLGWLAGHAAPVVGGGTGSLCEIA